MNRRRPEDDDGDDSKPPPAPSSSRHRRSPHDGGDGGGSYCDDTSFEIGNRVVICNLVKAADLNGRHGTIVSRDPSSGRFTVEMDLVEEEMTGSTTNTIAIKPKNLQREAPVVRARQPEGFSSTGGGAVSSGGAVLASKSMGDFAEVFPGASPPSPFEETNVKAMATSSGGRATVPGAVGANGGGGNDDFAEVYPDTSTGPPSVENTTTTKAKTKMVSSGDRAVVPGAVAVNDSYAPRSSSKFGDDDGSNPLDAPPQRGQYLAKDPASKPTPEVFADTERLTNGSYLAQQSKTIDKKKTRTAGNSLTSYGDAGERPGERPGAMRVEGPNQHTGMSEEDELLTAAATAATTTAATIATTSTDNQNLAIAAEVAADAEDIEAQVQQRLERETENIHQRILDEAVQADVYEDDTDEKLGRMKRWMILIICCVVIVAVMLVIVFVVILDKDGSSSLTANPTWSPTASLLPSSSPTSTPTMAPTFSPTPIPRCTLCADKSIPPNLTQEYTFGAEGTTCADFMEEQEKLTILDSDCLVGQALAWLSCDCPTTPPRPEDAVCSICKDGSIPIEVDNFTYVHTDNKGNCSDYHAFLGIVGDGPIFPCSDLVDIFDDNCRCPGDEAVRLEYFTYLLQPISGDIIHNSSSPQNQALMWLLSGDEALLHPETATDEVIQQRYVAALLYFSTGGPSWDSQNSFLSADDICSWNFGIIFGIDGIICSDDDGSIEISLESNNLNGVIPNEIKVMTTLKTIELSDNLLSGNIPEGIAELSMLEKVDVSSNLMTGALPDSIFTSQTLKELLLSENPWNGGSTTIPTVIGNATNLELFECNSCDLTSSIPESISNLVNLHTVNLEGNALTGFIPSFTKSTQLEQINLKYNNLTGPIPVSLGNLTKLEQLRLFGNFLNSTIPPELASLTSLITIDMGQNLLYGDIPPFYGSDLDAIWLVGNNLSGNLTEFFKSTSTSLTTIRFDANFISGTLSSDIGRLTSLNTIYLGQHSSFEDRRNSINGTIPTEIGRLTNLADLRLAELNLEGTVPTEVGYLSSLETIWLHTNSLNSTIPQGLASLTSLVSVSLSTNLLYGDVPPFYGTNLDGIWLAGNHLSGNLDEFFKSSSTSLKNIRLDANFLVGTISSEIGRLTNLKEVHLGQNSYYEGRRNSLNGTIPTEIGRLTNLEELQLLELDIEGTVPTETGFLTSLSVLNLYNLGLGGSLPFEMGNLINLKFLDLGQNNLTGIIPSEMGNCLSLTTVSFSDNQLNGAFPESIASLPELELLWIQGNNFRQSNYDKLFCSREDLIDNLTITCNGPCSCCTKCCTTRDNCTELASSNGTLSPVATPTNSPTVTMMPTLSCDVGTTLFRVSLTTDFYPNETSWDVRNVQSNVSVLQGGPYANNGVDGFVDEICLPATESCFEFTIYDAYGDGLIDHGGGEGFALFLNGEEIASGGEFAGSSSIKFGESCPSTAAPSIAPSIGTTSTSNIALDCDETAGSAFFRLTLNLDKFPEQSNWNLLDGNNFNFLFIEMYTDGVDSFETIVHELCLEIDNCYTFTIGDSNSDGICCGEESGNGSYELFFNGEIVKSGGEFGFLEQTFFGDGCS